MKKIIVSLLAVCMLFTLCACGDKKAAIEDTNDRGTVKVFLDGVEKASITVADFAKNTEEVTLNGEKLYGKNLADILGKTVDMTSVKAVFTKAVDGEAEYFATSGLFLATYEEKDGEMKSIEEDGKPAFNLCSADETADAVSEIYLLTKAQDWTVSFANDGVEKTLTIEDFMAMEPTYRTLKHKYDGGASEFEGDFLSVDTKTLMEYCGVELTQGMNDSGEPVYYAEHKLLTFVGGVQSAGTEIKIEKNTDLKGSPFVEKSGWMVYYFVLVNGNSYHDIVGADLGLSCIKNDTGMRWMCTPVQSVTLETSDTVKW